ncbi:Protein of unknown function (DUF3515) [Frankia sp. EI5c]|uniref:DUF3515 family protein n=1 Tax=Frankia sp. EI5c TaxID=683316 RepID=UPI0007C28E5A|nr:DUF3515 family protein [Frankia sp. EI5c]OAA20901.1 Protein of unknown function (DUF3515) [Frankia sp. EI5c]
MTGKVRLPPLRLRLAGLAGITAGLVSSCGGSGPVTITGVPTPTGGDQTACAAFVAALPDSLGEGLDRRDVSPPVATAAAFGSAPAVVTCGASGVGAAYQRTSVLSEIDDVGWFTEDLGDLMRYSTPTRSPQVVLTLPADRQAFEVLVALGPAVRAHTRPTVG